MKRTLFGIEVFLLPGEVSCLRYVLSVHPYERSTFFHDRTPYPDHNEN
jgi:hypothetical protein